jgi:hypothetical protein
MRNQFDFKVSCPSSTDNDTPVQQIRARGNLPLVLQEDMVIELKQSDLIESWRTACALGRKQAGELVQQAALRITSALNDGEFIDAPALASDTAAFFLLALRHKGLKSPSACAITFHDEHIEVQTETKLIN